MDDPHVTSASLPPDFLSVFASPDAGLWRTQVEQELKGVSFDKALITSLLEGLKLQPVYPVGEPVPPVSLGLRASSSPGWVPAQCLLGADPAQAGVQMQEDLLHGMGGARVLLNEAGGAGSGLDLHDGAALHALLDPSLVHADARNAFSLLSFRSGAQVETLVKRLADSGLTLPPGLRLLLGADPLGTLARTGEIPSDAWASTARVLLQGTSGLGMGPVRVLEVSTEPYHGAGAHAVQELGVLIAAVLETIRALGAEGIPAQQVISQLVVVLPVGRELFLEAAKLRAARVLLAKLQVGLGLALQPVWVHGVGAYRTLTRFDVWVNQLRTSQQGVAAGLGGVDSLSLNPIDALTGVWHAQSARVARNTHTILLRESHLGAVADPLAGSYFMEALTDGLARAAWTQFQQLEAEGGLRAVLASGRLQETLATTWSAFQERVARRQVPLTGVTEFPLETDTGLELPPVQEAASSRALPLHRDAEAFEALRDGLLCAAQRDPGLRTVFVACAGPKAEHNARTTFLQNLLVVGGFAPVLSDDQGFVETDLQGLVAYQQAAFRKSGARIACLSAVDAQYTQLALPLLAALREAGAEQVWLAGKPGALDASLTAAGLTGALFIGADVYALLKRMQAGLGLESSSLESRSH